MIFSWKNKEWKIQKLTKNEQKNKIENNDFEKIRKKDKIFEKKQLKKNRKNPGNENEKNDKIFGKNNKLKTNIF